jgi:very-short-patch-repair endonuclease
MTILRNKAEFKNRRRLLRKNFTDAERRLWSRLRRRQLFGFKFFRQYSVGSYIVDFYCPAIRLAIELDGGQHAQGAQALYDEKRTEYLNKHNIKVIRAWDDDALKNTDGVLLEISSNLTFSDENKFNSSQPPL